MDAGLLTVNLGKDGIEKNMDSEIGRPVFRGNIMELNALRAFAASAVVLAHTWPPTYPLSSLINSWWFLLDAFFVLSGFLIGGILLDSRDREDYYKPFFLRRVFRICPLYYLLIICLTVAVFWSARPLAAETLRHWGSPGWFFVFLGNIPTGVTGSWPLRSYTHLWSVQIEEQFYLLFPFLVRRLELATLKRLLWVLVFASPLLRIAIYCWDPGSTTAQYVLLPCRMEGLALGALIAIRFRQGSWELPRLQLTISTAVCVSGTLLLAILDKGEVMGPVSRTIGYLISSVASAQILLWLICFRGSRTTAVLRLAPIQHVGKIAYGIYLLHVPISSYLGAVLRTNAFNVGIRHVLAVYILTIICASVSWMFLESPLIELGKRFSGSVSSFWQRTRMEGQRISSSPPPSPSMS